MNSPAPMTPTEDLIDKAAKFIAQWEGCKLKSYRDVGGVWTVGYGATGADVKSYTTWTQEQADERLREDLELREMQLEKLLGGCPTTDNQKIALLSLAFNIGMGALARSTTLREHKIGHYKPAADAILLWEKVNGHVVQGLVNRREAERRLYLT